MRDQTLSKHRYTNTLRGWLLSYNLAMLSIILILVIILFGLAFSLLSQMQTRNNRYEAINTLSSQLMKSHDRFQTLLSEQDEPSILKLIEDFTFLEQEIRASINRLAVDYEIDSERYFLHRGIANGLTFIQNAVITLSEMNIGQQNLEYFNLFYTTDKVYAYLQDYTFNRYLSKLVESDINWIIETEHRILNYRGLSVLFLLLIALIYSIASYKMTMRLVVPVNSMVKTAEQIFHGKFDGPTIPLNGPLEIQYLEESINQMRDSLKERIEMIEQNARLEKTLHANELEQLRTTRELEKARYKALQSQINPHFLFNTLNIIGRTALFENANTTVDILASLASIFRYTLEYHEDVSLEEELQFVREYLIIQQHRFHNRLMYSIICPDNLSELRIPPLVIQPFVENAMIHGLEPKEEGGELHIKVTASGNNVLIIIMDTGVGINLNEQRQKIHQSKQHIGIENIKGRLSHYYEGRSEVVIERISEEGGTKVTLSLPYPREGVNHVHTTYS